MGKILSILGGIIAIILAIILLFKWISIVIMGLKFCVVIMLLFGGLMAVVFGIIEIRDSVELKKMEKEEKGKEESID